MRSGMLIESSLSMSRANHKVSNPRASYGEAFAQNVRHPNCVFKSRSQSSSDELPVPLFFPRPGTLTMFWFAVLCFVRFVESHISASLVLSVHVVPGFPYHVGYSSFDSSIARVVGGRNCLRPNFKFDVCSFRVGECLPEVVEWSNSPHVTRSLRTEFSFFLFVWCFSEARLYRIFAYFWRLPQASVLA